ncbi:MULTISPECIES: hypothetical protein [unclassified Streptomyces]|uniref:Uncharacterized protein n=1 Tax=Streptomyces sp. NBC_00119 TaxID=2975659 RepID=A0AAU1UJR0_9ACTN|nr:MULTISPECIES: hypothetical protein [unclassified Streptomyces]MCX4650214.1 hypothetical protein [Streptomyces sp. NBC_01446]
MIGALVLDSESLAKAGQRDREVHVWLTAAHARITAEKVWLRHRISASHPDLPNTKCLVRADDQPVAVCTRGAAWAFGRCFGV